jgi:hypothetical protein
MSKKVDFIAHGCLYGALLVGAYAMYLSRFNPGEVYAILMFIVVYYLVWGFAYHHLKNDFKKKLFLEYVMIALIALGAGYLVFMS